MLNRCSILRDSKFWILFIIFNTTNIAGAQDSQRQNRSSFKIQGSGKVLNLKGDKISNASIDVYIPNDPTLISKSITEEQFILFKMPKSETSEHLSITDSAGNYELKISLRWFMNESQRDFIWLRSQIEDPKSKAFYFLLVCKSADNQIKIQQWFDLKALVSLSTFPPPAEDILFKFPDQYLLNPAESIEAVKITAQAVTIKGDTTEMNAANFKVNPDASAEDLVSKMPGVTSSNGQVQAQGEAVKKVLVDGKPFFGEDPNAALKNLPAEVVSKIQIYDAKSDQSLFSGIDDGNTTKTMNIVTKSQFRNGLFGKGFGGYGNTIKGTGDISKYKGGINLNAFSGNRRISVLSQINNINEQNFSFEDIVGSIGSGGNRSGGMGSGGMGSGGNRGGGMGGNFFVGNQSGITTTRAIGLNYSNQWGKKLEFSSSYFLNSTHNNNESSTNRTYIGSQKSGLSYIENNPSFSDNFNHRFNMRLNWKVDSLNTLLIEPKLTLQSNGSTSPLTAITRSLESLPPLDVLSKLGNKTNTQTQGIKGNVSVLYRHAFSKKGRTLSTQINPGITTQNGYTQLLNSNIFNFPVLDTTGRDQKTQINKINKTLNANAIFTESLDSNHFIAGTVAINYNQNNNDRLAYLYDMALNMGYTLFDTNYSSKFANGYRSEKIGASYMYQTYKWEVTASVDAQMAQLDGSQTYPKNLSLNRNFTSLLPGFQARYKLGTKKNLRLNYSTSNNAPSVDQLQPVINNNNTMQLSIGNRLLVQDYQHSFFMRYFSVNPETGKNLFFMVNAQTGNNYISNKTILGGQFDQYIYLKSSTFGGENTSGELIDSVKLSPGAQLTLPINVNGFFSARAFGSYGKNFKKINVNSNGGIGITSTPSVIQIGNYQALTNTSVNPSANAGLVISSTVSEKFDFNVAGNLAVNKVINSIQKNNNQTYLNYNSKAMVNYMPTKKWVINTDITYTKFSGLSSSYNQKFYLWNAGLGYKFMKNNAAEFRLTAYDILNQNRSIQRNVTQTYYEDVQTKVLTRYVMLTFTYKLRKFNGKGDDGKDMKMMFPGGMPPSGMPWHGIPGR